MLCIPTINAWKVELHYALKLCVSTADTTNTTSTPVVGASVQCDNITRVYITKSDGCTGLMGFASSHYPSNVKCEINEGCINTTEFTTPWFDLDWSTITSKTAQVEVKKNDESCVFSMAPSSSPVAQPRDNGSDAGTVVALVVSSFAFILLVAILVKTFTSEDWKNNGSDFNGTGGNENCCKSFLNGCCIGVDCCCC